ncbi:hypothetical protein [Algibacter mikhailovii]|uniref:hypothetical protein n=1 Tax=Algibacter mikhailovii TaxID=425498 RepID=UPI0024944BF6|nr:hypothetical protein [Algibacter mikhailovii]
MAKQSGIIKLKGTIDDISFYKSSDGYLARAKGGVDAKRIKNDPAFQRTRENGSEFGRAGKNAKLIRNSMRLLLQNAKDKRMVSRLTKDVLAVIKTDSANPRGQRIITEGNLKLIENFDFNINGKLGTTLYAAFTNDYDRASGDSTLNIASFQPKQRIAAPEGTTHYKITMAAAELNFVDETFVFGSDDTGIVAYDDADTTVDLTASVSANSNLMVIQVLGIEFFQMVNGVTYPLKNGNHNALAIILTDEN